MNVSSHQCATIRIIDHQRAFKFSPLFSAWPRSSMRIHKTPPHNSAMQQIRDPSIMQIIINFPRERVEAPQSAFAFGLRFRRSLERSRLKGEYRHPSAEATYANESSLSFMAFLLIFGDNRDSIDCRPNKGNGGLRCVVFEETGEMLQNFAPTKYWLPFVYELSHRGRSHHRT